MMRRAFTVSLSAVFACGLVATASTPGSASVDDGQGTESTVRKTVLSTGDADGQISDRSMVIQVASAGTGTGVVEVPVGDSSVRNLDGFESLSTSGDTVAFMVDVDGTQAQRAYTKTDVAPIDVAVSATLDGKPIDPGEVIDKSGVLEVTYRVTNTTVQPVETSYENGAGNQVPLSVDMGDPFVGTLDVTLPPEFAEVTAPGATAAGDGKGGTQLGYQMVLFEPLGSTTETLTYQARVSRGSLPAATFGFLPIVPYDNSTIATTQSSYASGADSGRQIYSAGEQIGENLLKLQSGIGQLVSGLGQLAAGAQTLGDGLTDTAIPGANAIAAGADELAKGLNDKALPAAQELATGSKKLSDGLTDDLVPGTEQIADGLNQVDDALRTLPTTVKSAADYQKLIGGVEQLQIALAQLADNQGPVLKGFADQTTTYLESIKSRAASGDCTGSACADIIQDATSGEASNGNVVVGITGIIDNAQTGAAGLIAVEDGISELVDTIAENLYDNPDWQDLVAGGQTLEEGAIDAADGARQLADVNEQLSEGLVAPADGASQLADGGEKLAEGLVPAAEGAETIAEKLGEAETGATQAQDGAGQLKTEGADKLLESGDQAAVEFATKVAMLDSLQEAGEQGAGIPYGNATGPNTTTTGAYQVVLSEASNEGANDVIRYLVAALGFLAAGLVGTMVWRRRGL